MTRRVSRTTRRVPGNLHRTRRVVRPTRRAKTIFIELAEFHFGTRRVPSTHFPYIPNLGHATLPNHRSMFLGHAYHVKLQTLRACMVIKAPNVYFKFLMELLVQEGLQPQPIQQLYDSSIQGGSRSEVTTSDLAHSSSYQLENP